MPVIGGRASKALGKNIKRQGEHQKKPEGRVDRGISSKRGEMEARTKAFFF